MLTQQDITELLSGFYARWALTMKGKDMVLMAELIEQLRPALEKEDAYDAWDYLKADAEKFRNDHCIMALAELRQHFFELLFEKQFAAVQQLAQTDKAGAEKLLRQYFAEGLVHFREDFTCLLLKQDFQPDHAFATWKTTISKVPLLLQETRWVDLYTTFQEIYNDPGIGVKERCLAEVISGQIVLYNFPVFTQAEKHFQRAMELQPDYMVPKRGLGELYLKKGEFQKARELFLEVIGKQPQDYTSYNLVGDTFFEETKIKLAQEQKKREQEDPANTDTKTTLPKDLFTNEEFWYKEGWRINFLQTESCRRLVTMYSFNSAILAAHNSRIPELLKIVEQQEWYPEKKRFRFTGENYASCFNDVTYYVTCRDLANNYQAIGEDAKAEKLFIETIQLQPQLSPAYLDLAYLQIREEKYEAAKEHLDKALALNKDNYDTWWCLAYYYEKTKKKSAAIQAYHTCKQLRPFWSDWLDNFIGNVYFDYGEYELAIPCYRAAMTQNPEYKIYKDNFLLAQQKLADQKEKVGNTEAAIELYQQIAAETNAPGDWNKIGNLYYRLMQFAAAAPYYQKAVALVPEEPIYHENLGLVYKKQGWPDKAEPEFLEAVRLNTRDGDSLNQLGLFYYELQQYDEALKWYQQALEKDPGNFVYNWNIGLVHEKKADFTIALTYYEHAAKNKPEDDTIQNQIGLVYFNQGNYSKAIEYFQKAATLNNTKSVYLENIGSSYVLLNKNEEAENYYRKAIAIDPANDKAFYYLAIIHLEQKKYQTAIEYLNQALSLDPNNPAYIDKIAKAYSDSGEKQQAIAIYKQALELNDNDYLHWNALGNLLSEAGDSNNALNAYEKAILLRPDDKVLYRNKALVYIQLNRWEDARELVNNQMDEYEKTQFIETAKRLFPEVRIDDLIARSI